MMSFRVRLVLFVLVLFVLVGCVSAASSCCPSAAKAGCGSNALTKGQVEDGWVLLFDGKSCKGWVGLGKDKFPETGWEIKEGVLTVNPVANGSKKKRGGAIVTVEMYDDFELKLDFKLTEGANSGIKYFVRDEDAKKGKELGLEFQVLDDKKHPDAKKGINGNRTVASLYDLIAADKGKEVKAVGEWNTARIVSKGKHVEHWLNGKKVLEYERGSKEFAELIAISKFKNIKDFGLAEKGHIVLQDHKDTVSYKNIMIKKLVEPCGKVKSAMVDLVIELPPLMLAGTPKNLKIKNLEKPRGKGEARPTMLVPAGTSNAALNKSVTSTSFDPIVGAFADITDGDKAGDAYVELDPFEQSITIDLGASYEIYAIVIWHYHKETMAYFDVVVQTADDADFIGNVNTLFNNDIDNTHGLGIGSDKNYLESYEGKLIDAKGVVGRYVKCLSASNSSNDMNHYIEVEVFGKPVK